MIANPKSTNHNGELKKMKIGFRKDFNENGASIGSGSVIMCGIKIGRNTYNRCWIFSIKSIPSKKIFNKRNKNFK